MGIINSKEFTRKIDEATSNSSLSNLRYVTTDKSKWKMFRKREVAPISTYPTSLKARKGCPCGSSAPCKQKVTPKGVTLHYPQKKKKMPSFRQSRYKAPKIDKGYLSSNQRDLHRVTIVRPRKFPTWRLDRINYSAPYFRNFKTIDLHNLRFRKTFWRH